MLDKGENSLIYIVGDIHGSISKMKDIVKIIKLDKPDLNSEDYIISLGDFGYKYIASNNLSYYPKHMIDECVDFDNYIENLPATILTIDGNHENFKYWFSQDNIEMFNSEVSQLGSNVFWLKRGQIYNINDRKIFTMGGGLSIDKCYRRENVSWWFEELPNENEMNSGLDALNRNKNDVDLILTHSAPYNIESSIFSLYGMRKCEDPLNDTFLKYLDCISQNVSFKYWMFGHYHFDQDIDRKYFCLYNKVIKMTSEGHASIIY